MVSLESFAPERPYENSLIKKNELNLRVGMKASFSLVFFQFIQTGIESKKTLELGGEDYAKKQSASKYREP